MAIADYLEKNKPAPFGLGDLIGTIKMGADVVTQNWPAVALDAANGIARWTGNKQVGDSGNAMQSALQKFMNWKQKQNYGKDRLTDKAESVTTPGGFGAMPFLT